MTMDLNGTMMRKEAYAKIKNKGRLVRPWREKDDEIQSVDKTRQDEWSYLQ